MMVVGKSPFASISPQAVTLAAFCLLAACTHHDPALHPMELDNIITCQKKDGTLYEVNDGNCGDGAQVRTCWIAQQAPILVHSRKECTDRKGRMYRPTPN